MRQKWAAKPRQQRKCTAKVPKTAEKAGQSNFGYPCGTHAEIAAFQWVFNAFSRAGRVGRDLQNVAPAPHRAG